MEAHRSGCIRCGKPLQYFDDRRTLKCGFCGKAFETEVACEDGHYVCDGCHSQKGFEAITEYALKTDSKSPALIARDMMKNGYIHMHGPEHHYLVVAALLAAYANAGGAVDLEDALNIARQRAKDVPGGICGMWGCCGAAVGTGIFISIITGATPLATDSWSMANAMTSQSLDAIAARGGPRCCKRDVWTAIEQAVGFTSRELGIHMEYAGNLTCRFFPLNNECIAEKCTYYPDADKEGLANGK